MRSVSVRTRNGGLAAGETSEEGRAGMHSSSRLFFLFIWKMGLRPSFLF